jgi:hypothetical protein
MCCNGRKDTAHFLLNRFAKEVYMTEKQFHPGDQHPEEWRRDLNPDAMAGQNIGPAGAQQAKDAVTAYELKEIHRQFHGFDDSELKRIPILPRGSRLEQGATYVDLQDQALREFTATGDMSAGPNNWYVPKSEVDYQLWNRLIGIANPERLGDADER